MLKKSKTEWLERLRRKKSGQKDTKVDLDEQDSLSSSSGDNEDEDTDNEFYTSEEEIAEEKKKPSTQPFVDFRSQIKFYLLLGPPNSGKSHLGRQLITDGAKEQRWNHILILAVTADSGDYDFIDKRCCCSDPDQFEQRIESFIHYQIIFINEARENNRPAPRGLIWIDDPLGSVNWNRPIWKKIASTFRQWFTDIGVLAQYIAALPKSFYTFYSKAFVFNQPQEDDYKRVYQRFLARWSNVTGFKDFRDVQKLLQSLEEHSFLIVDSDKKAQKPVSIGKAKPLSSFQHIKISF